MVGADTGDAAGELMLDARGMGLSVLQILLHKRKLSHSQFSICQQHADAGENAGGARTGSAKGAGVAYALEAGWLQAGDVAEANYLREKTKHLLIQMFHQERGLKEAASAAARFRSVPASDSLPSPPSPPYRRCLSVCECQVRVTECARHLHRAGV